ncbi:MAG: methyltransferase [Myxococcota bacterium]
MRNPIRLKNLRARFLPLYLAGAAILLVTAPGRGALVAALPPILAGTVLRGWGAGHLVKNDALTTTGPYAHLRHPLYLGTLLIGTGFAIAVGGRLSVVVLALLWPWFALHYFPRKEAAESDRLLARHGERFARYRDAVPALLPSLRPWHDAGDSGAGVGWALARYSDNNELGTFLAVVAGWLVFWWRSGAPG